MAPKVNCNPSKLASIVAHFQKSRVAHSIKDLEKQLPSVASINGMQVKDYLQALTDDNRINVEKIGSGNWYWSFASEENWKRQRALEDALSAHHRGATTVDDLKQKLTEARAQCAEENMLDSGDESRQQLMARKARFELEIKGLQKQLAAHSDTDPIELERKEKEISAFKAVAEQCTDDIYCMEGWLKDNGQDEDIMKALRISLYGDELDAEEGVLKELA